ncbi:hypothetical protein LJ655_08380 [Paraburkholderia sp. MMS20-SJTN17]|uniref:Uncharacterized protein n=1 Tax=Paraburkholderia translucens TaxID=2886945 RepID=A0ABS8KBU9_9BURK|nr:hypothetical protein [Paraburkholderia sp. MMS20-SJTN17]MCC8401907.1 hypothetical protein [Paraburkholderia sp. MMS20-SJTN17]
MVQLCGIGHLGTLMGNGSRAEALETPETLNTLETLVEPRLPDAGCAFGLRSVRAGMAGGQRNHMDRRVNALTG